MPSARWVAIVRAVPGWWRFGTHGGAREPDWHNAPVPSFGGRDARLLIVGLAPGLQGANRTGRPFTGDYAGDLLYATLAKFGFAGGDYAARPDDGLALVDAGSPMRCAACRRKTSRRPRRSPIAAIFSARPLRRCRTWAHPCARPHRPRQTVRPWALKRRGLRSRHGARHRAWTADPVR